MEEEKNTPNWLSVTVAKNRAEYEQFMQKVQEKHREFMQWMQASHEEFIQKMVQQTAMLHTQTDTSISPTSIIEETDNNMQHNAGAKKGIYIKEHSSTEMENPKNFQEEDGEKNERAESGRELSSCPLRTTSLFAPQTKSSSSISTWGSASISVTPITSVGASSVSAIGSTSASGFSISIGAMDARSTVDKYLERDQIFGSTPILFGNSSFGGNITSFSSPSTSPFGGISASFGSSSLPKSGGTSSLFGSVNTPMFSLPTSGGTSSLFGSVNTPMFSLPTSGGTSSLFGSVNTPMFGSNSNPSFGSAQFFGASGSASSSQSTAASFGSRFGCTPSLASTGFSFGGSVAASSGSFTIGTSSCTSTGTYTFGSKDTSTLTPQSMFELRNSNLTFGATTTPVTPPSDHMEDSMAKDLAQESAPPVFVGQSASSASGLVFSFQQNVRPSFMHNSQPSPQVANSYATGGQSAFTPPAGALEFSGRSFSLGAAGAKPRSKYVKIKRDRVLEFSGGSFSLGAAGAKPRSKYVQIKRDRERKK